MSRPRGKREDGCSGASGGFQSTGQTDSRCCLCSAASPERRYGGVSSSVTGRLPLLHKGRAGLMEGPPSAPFDPSQDSDCNADRPGIIETHDVS